MDADKIAKELGSPRSANIVILGASIPFLEIEYSKLENSLNKLFSRKGEAVLKKNLDAMKAGKEYTEKHMNVIV